LQVPVRRRCAWWLTLSLGRAQELAVTEDAAGVVNEGNQFSLFASTTGQTGVHVGAKHGVGLPELVGVFHAEDNLQTVRAYLLKEDFHRFWEYRRAAWAKRFLKRWCTRVLRSQLEPMKKVARTLRNHEPLILNWFRAKGMMSSGVVEGLNYNVKLTMRKAYGFRTYEAVETALYHRLGRLPEPEFTHRFC
jgi:Transposase